MKKPLLLIGTLVFAAFAYLNLNDPDPIVWVLAYGAVAVLFALAAFGKADRRVIGGYTAALAVWMLTLVGGMIDWFRSGMPSITEEMKANEPHIEVVREFLGLLIAVGALVWLYMTQRRSGNAGS